MLNERTRALTQRIEAIKRGTPPNNTKGDSMLSKTDSDVLKLIKRSPDIGDGWRSVSSVCWQLVESFQQKELIEVDEENRRVRLTDAGDAVVTFAL